MGLIYWLSSQPQLPRLPEPLWQTLLAKTAHLGEYGILALLLLFAVRERQEGVGARSPRPKGIPAGRYLLVSAIAIAYAASDEFHQSFVPNRTASGWDVLIDTAGVLVTLFVAARAWPGRGDRAPT